MLWLFFSTKLYKEKVRGQIYEMSKQKITFLKLVFTQWLNTLKTLKSWIGKLVKIVMKSNLQSLQDNCSQPWHVQN